MRHRKSILFLCVGLTVLMSPSLFAQIELQYQNRGDRYEGVKLKPVSGYDIELISVLADYREPISEMPDQLKLKFYLRDAAAVQLIVRELDFRAYYWLDRVRPETAWAAGFENQFVWSTEVVLRPLGLNMYDLGVLARVGYDAPRLVERVAPAILYHSSPPEMIQGYLFTLKTSGDARLSCSIYPAEGEEPITTQVFRRKRGGRPFTFHWVAASAAPGRYRLVVSGFNLRDNQRFDQTVEFDHEPQVQ